MNTIIKMDFNISKMKEFLQDNLYSCKLQYTKVDSTFHHNTYYSKAQNIIENGILSLNEMEKHNNIKLKQKEKEVLKSEYHVNGLDYVSVSSTKNINESDYNNIYDNKRYDEIDFNISSNIKALKNDYRYKNEFIVKDNILQDKFTAIDIRILSNDSFDNERNILKTINNYNYLMNIAFTLKKVKLNIPIREVGNEYFNLDLDKTSNLPKIKIYM